jgi:addiction module HigA family antidote
MTIRGEERLFSDLAIPPGELLEEELQEIGMTQNELARRTGRPAQAINELIRGKKAITHKTALEFERVLGIPAHIWVNLQASYDLTNARISDMGALKDQENWLDDFPVKEMENRGWIETCTSNSDKVRALLNFFGVASFRIWRESAQELLGFRISERSKVSLGALAVWLRKGEIEGYSVAAEEYDEARFMEALRSIRRLTHEDPDVFEPQMKALCASAGVALVLVPELPESGANGVARWLRKDKALIQLSLKYKWSDIFWFSFFHEACHVLEHDVRDVYIDGLDGEPQSEEEANCFARDWLIPPQKWNQFVNKGAFTLQSVKTFATEIGIAPGIVVGRMQHDRLIPWNSRLNRLRERFVWCDDED